MRCAPLNEISGEIISVSNVKELSSAAKTINTTGGNKTVLLEDGTYILDDSLWVAGDNIIFRSASGKRDAVIIKGKGMSGDVSHIFNLRGSNITIADMTIGEVANHAIQIHRNGERGESTAHNLFVHNVRIYNTGEQMLKGSNDEARPNSEGGLVECSLFEFTEGKAYQYRGSRHPRWKRLDYTR
jgi:hypothetical protein